MTTLRELEGTRWVGRSELWLDPLGNKADTCDCTISLQPNEVAYTWSYEGKPHTGKLSLRDGAAEFWDSFHAEKPIPFKPVDGSWALVDVHGTYTVGDSPAWGWRIYVSLRPDSDELVVQMTNITPWGEDGRAVRMICKRA
jgi:hypothetical protein